MIRSFLSARRDRGGSHAVKRGFVPVFIAIVMSFATQATLTHGYGDAVYGLTARGRDEQARTNEGRFV